MAGKNIDFKNNITKRIKGQAVCNPTNIPSEFRSEFLKISIAVCNIPTRKSYKYQIEANFGYGFVFLYLRPIFRAFLIRSFNYMQMAVEFIRDSVRNCDTKPFGKAAGFA